MSEETMEVTGSQIRSQEAGREKRGGERLLAFSLCAEEYAIPLMKVKEVIAYTEITPVPYTPPHFKGIMNLRGQVISIIDLRTKFRMAKAEVGAETAIIILDLEPLCLGVVVDSVNSVVSVASSDISPPPDVESSSTTEYITGVARRDKRLILLLDIERTLSVEDMRAMHENAARKAA